MVLRVVVCGGVLVVSCGVVLFGRVVCCVVLVVRLCVRPVSLRTGAVFFVWSFVVLILSCRVLWCCSCRVACCVVLVVCLLFLLYVCVCDLFLFLQVETLHSLREAQKLQLAQAVVNPKWCSGRVVCCGVVLVVSRVRLFLLCVCCSCCTFVCVTCFSFYRSRRCILSTKRRSCSWPRG